MQTAGAIDADNYFILTMALPSRAEKVLVLGIVPGILVIAFCIAKPFAMVPLHPIEGFISFYATSMFLNGLITAILLFAQFSLLRTRSLLLIANGYLFLALITIPYALAFPGVSGPGSLLGSLQSSAWLYIFRHCGFAMFVSAFALSKDVGVKTSQWQSNGRQAIILSVASTSAVVLAVGLLCIAGGAKLPIIINDRFQFEPAWVYYAGLPVASLCIFALTLLWFQRHTILGLWLMVVLFAQLLSVPLTYYPVPMRYSVGWYSSVMLNFTANSIVLIVLLVEISKLYARLLHAVRAQHREREARLVTGDAVAAMIAHEVKQPLAAIITRAETSLRRLGRSVPDIDKATEDIKQIAADGYRAGAVVDSIRANFKKDSQARTSLNVNGLIGETIALVRDDLQNHRILLKTEPGAGVPEVVGDRTQLQQVLLNLVANAIDSMATEDGARILAVRSEVRDNSKVVVSVADTGGGINSEDTERVFHPLFTTKSGGMGMGLSICRSIIEAHDGRIWVVPNHPKGAVFYFAISLEVTGVRV